MNVRGNKHSASGQARRFLLGELSSAEAEQFEEELLGSADLFTEVEAAEDDLFDAFAREELTPGERRAFVERFGDQHQRIVFARTLDAKVRTSTAVPELSRRVGVRYYLAAAASIIVVAGTILLWRSQPAAPTAKVESSPVVRTTSGIRNAIASAPSAASTATLEIALAGTRGVDGAPRLVLSPVIREIALRIRFNPADRFPAYAVLIRRGDGSNLWRGTAAVASPGMLEARAPSSGFTDGDYELAVVGLRQGVPEEDLGFRTIKISRRPISP